MQTAGRKQKQVFNEINITPLTDIFLVLLIIMMVVAPMVSQMRKDIAPPEISQGQPVEQNRLTVEITKDGSYYVQGQQTPADQLSTVLREQAALAAQPEGAPADAQTSPAPAEPSEKNVIVRADKATKSSAILKVFEAARDAEFTKVTVAGEALSEQRQSQLQTGAQTGIGTEEP